MKSPWKDVWIAIWMGLILPGVLVEVVSALPELAGQEAVAASVVESPEPAQGTLPPAAPAVPLVALVRDGSGSCTRQDMDAYLTGVVLAEMPASFEPEALKAQAVAARTYTRKAAVTGGKHADGSVCTQSVCCQAYLRPEEYLAAGGTQEHLEKVRQAVLATSGQVLTYEGELIEATYFSCSGGSTEDAVAVWGTDFPYLQAVDSPGEEAALHFTDTVTFSPEEFQEALGLSLSGDPASWFRDVTFTQGGGIAAMTVGEQVFSGTQLRSLLGLNSTAFAVLVDQGQIQITTRGYGHRVGMSQYGAEAMALGGSSWQQILAHYYPGTEIVCLPPDG